MTLKEKLGKKLIGSRGVSPVIVIILMVAITVILAAIIGTFVMGLGNNVNTEVQAGASITVNQDTNNATVTWVSKGTADNLSVETTGDGDPSNLDNVGNSTTFEVEKDDVIKVIAHSSDGKATVVAQKTV